MSFRNTGHFLRLAYSINEQAGGVSVPIYPDPGNPDAIYDFNPSKAKIDNVRVIKDWWYVPEDAPERTSEMIKFIIERKSISIPKKMKPKGLRKVAAKQFQRLPTQFLIAPGTKARMEVLRKLQMPYEQMIKTGQQIIQRRETLMAETNFPEALETLKSIHGKYGVVSAREVSHDYEVNMDDLWFLWRWTLREHIFHYYARDDVQEAMFLHSVDRKIRLGAEDVIVDLQDPADILPLAVYIHETQGAVDYPAFYCTNTKYDATTDDVIGCDVVLKIDGKGDIDTTGQLTRWSVSLLRDAGIDFALVLIWGPLSQFAHHSESIIQNPLSNVIIPSESLPGMPQTEAEFARVIGNIEKIFRKAVPGSERIEVLQMGEYMPLFYSVNDVSGLANVPVRIDDPGMEPKFRSLSDVQVTNDWWDIPAQASSEMLELFSRIVQSP
jgi:hypothetical protein